MGVEAIRITITQHVLEQWRRRIARYGDESHDEIRLAVLESRPAGEHELGTIAQLPRQSYFRHDDLNIVFVVESNGFRANVVTVLTPKEIAPSCGFRNRRPQWHYRDGPKAAGYVRYWRKRYHRGDKMFEDDGDEE